VRYSIFHNLGAPGRLGAYAAVMDEARAFAGAAEDAGFWSIWYTEHHFGHEGYEIVPNPVVMATDIAARTSRIRIGQAANIITFWHPLRLAEDLALLDQLSGGRLEVGVGRGLYGREALNLNPIADPRNEAQNRALFEETLDVMRAAWSEEFFAHHGRFYEFPQPGVRWNHPLSPPDGRFVDERGMIARMSITPRPLQRPHPPLWQVIDTPRSIRWAAEHGLQGIFWLPPVSALRERFALYRDTAAAAGRVIGKGEGIALVRDCYVAPTMEQARREFEAALMTSYRWIMHWRGMRNLLHPGEEPGSLGELTFDLLADRNLLVGTPEHVAERIVELRDEVGLEHLMLWTTHPGLEHAHAMASLELFAGEVMPLVAAAGVTV
jgi:alkanesulfonate monooxygenase SsuD/methylene tetrahydromethanopterin reductase-like flavin-dependent oxidoreductase (luciferase family)